MKITNQRVAEFLGGLNNLSTEFGQFNTPVGQRKLPIKLAFAVRKNRKVLLKLYETYDETRLERLAEYAKTDSDGGIKFEKKIPEGGTEEQQIAVFKSQKAEDEYTDIHDELLEVAVDFKPFMVPESYFEGLAGIEEHILAGVEFIIKGWEEDVVAGDKKKKKKTPKTTSKKS